MGQWEKECTVKQAQISAEGSIRVQQLFVFDQVSRNVKLENNSIPYLYSFILCFCKHFEISDQIWIVLLKKERILSN